MTAPSESLCGQAAVEKKHLQQPACNPAISLLKKREGFFGEIQSRFAA